MDLQRQLTFSVDSYDGMAKVFETHVKDLALSTIERGQFDTRVLLEETFECTSKEIFNLMAEFGKTYSTGGSSILAVNDEFLLKSEVIRDEGIVRFKLWILSVRERMDDIQKVVLEKFQPFIYQRMALDISWAIAARNGVDYIDLQTELDEIIQEESYPYMGGVAEYVDSFLNHRAPVLILIGAPGTGKTRFIKHILKTIGLKKNKAGAAGRTSRDELMLGDDEGPSRRCTKNPSILYSMEDKIFKDDQFFVRFLAESYDAMVLEDIDFNLGSRKDGNTFMYKLLGGSDGMISGIKRKIILSTNLRGISNIDEALLRPGRCFDTLHTRALTPDEAQVLAAKLGKDLAKVKKKAKEEYTLADIYNIKD